MSPDLISGGLIGWRRKETAHGCVITLQIATEREAFYNGGAQNVSIALNDRQIRSLTRDLQRLAEHRNIQLWAKPKLFDRIFRRRKRLPQ